MTRSALASFTLISAAAVSACGCVDRGPATSQPGPAAGAQATAPSTPAPAPKYDSAIGKATAPVVVKCDAPSHPISRLIYGTSVQPMRDKPEQWTFGTTARRWGGNHTTRYNWQLGNAWNTGHDWFFKNVEYEHAREPAYERFIATDLAHGVATALTLPIMGWVAKDTTSYGFPVSIFGEAQATESGHPDVGNGVSKTGSPVTPRSPEQTSIAMPPEGIGRWVRAIREKDQARGKRGVQMYILDNEPMLWNETHRDIHPEPVSYDELLDKTTRYAVEVRKADPEAVIAAPALWGFPALFTSGVDKLAAPAHPDRDKHGGMAFLPWWLRETAAFEKRTGQHLLDVVDVHFYPQGKNIGIGASGGTDPDTAARRLRSTRALWDPDYKDESWIAEPVRLIPRLKSWIAAEHPGLGISIGEYNFGAETHMSGGLAVAEALGRFGSEGITSAFYWDYPPPGSPAQMAFRAFLDFDGKGGRFLDTSVPATTLSPGVSVFASRDAASEHLVLVILNTSPTDAVAATTDASTCGAIASHQTFTYAAGSPGFAPRKSTGGEDPGSLVTPLPPYSITVVDLHVARAK